MFLPQDANSRVNKSYLHQVLYTDGSGLIKFSLAGGPGGPPAFTY